MSKRAPAGMQRKVWQVWPVASQRNALCRQFNIHPLTAQVLINRNLTEPGQVHQFLAGKLTNLVEPHRLLGIPQAVERILVAVDKKQKIVIYGDYDVDGITGVAILWHLLTLLGANVDFYIPHRVDEGYGLNEEAIRSIADSGCQLLITVDCGICAVGPVALAYQLGMDVIITDHHRLPAQLPAARAIVHPLLDKEYPNPDSSGAMVAFKLAWALAESQKRAGKMPDLLRQFLINATTLAGIGTIADVVSLTGENRILARFGLKAIDKSNLLGIRTLIETAQLASEAVDSYDVAYRLAPMLNAAGRMGHARLAVELLTTSDLTRAFQISQYLKEQNRLRQKCQQDILKQVRQQILQRQLHHPDRRTIVMSGENWHIGVIGIVAARVIDEFFRPTIMINIANGLGQGSGRSVKGFDLYQALTACSEHLVSFGGHTMAAGLKVKTDKIPAFAEAFEAYAQAHPPMAQEEVLMIDAEVQIGDVDQRLMRELEMLEPFGEGNPEPIFAVRGVRLASPPRRVGAKNDHLQMAITDGTGSVRCIGFGHGGLEKKLLEVDSFSVAFKPQYNTYNGLTMLQFVIEDILLDD